MSSSVGTANSFMGTISLKFIELINIISPYNVIEFLRKAWKIFNEDIDQVKMLSSSEIKEKMERKQWLLIICMVNALFNAILCSGIAQIMYKFGYNYIIVDSLIFWGMICLVSMVASFKASRGIRRLTPVLHTTMDKEIQNEISIAMSKIDSDNEDELEELLRIKREGEARIVTDRSGRNHNQEIANWFNWGSLGVSLITAMFLVATFA